MCQLAPLSPQKFREALFQLIYAYDLGGDCESSDMLMAQLALSKRHVKRVEGVKEHFFEKRAEIDALIVLHSQSYELERIPRVERNLVRLGVYELLFTPEVPGKVVIAEMVRLTRKFATREAANFVNALMDAIYQSLNKPIHSLPEGQEVSHAECTLRAP